MSTLEYHIAKLSGLCRVCGSTVACGNFQSYPVEKHKERLTKTYGNHFENETNHIHPPYFCNRCYSCVLNYEKRNSQTTLESVAEWHPCDSFSCRACCFTKGRPKKKRSIKGRPKKVATISDLIRFGFITRKLPF